MNIEFKIESFEEFNKIFSNYHEQLFDALDTQVLTEAELLDVECSKFNITQEEFSNLNSKITKSELNATEQVNNLFKCITIMLNNYSELLPEGRIDLKEYINFLSLVKTSKFPFEYYNLEVPRLISTKINDSVELKNNIILLDEISKREESIKMTKASVDISKKSHVIAWLMALVTILQVVISIYSLGVNKKYKKDLELRDSKPSHATLKQGVGNGAVLNK